jgi:endonuclease/exonuclease/phosphatase family metal-dependent hydrolase
VKWLIAWLLICGRLVAAPLTVATYNLEFYVDAPTLDMPPKSDEARRIIRESIRRMNPDVIALQEVGSLNTLQELRQSLKREGVEFKHSEYVNSIDPNLHLAFLSKLPIISRRPHTNESFLYRGKRFRVSRGFAEIELANGKDRITLITAHLKSKRQLAEADQQELREEEATVLREKIDDFFQREPNGKLIVLGDFNDSISSKTLRTIFGRGQTRLFDPRPAERNGDTLPHPNSRYEPRRIVWTHYYGKEESYSRVDYILVSPALRHAVNASETYVLAMPDWGAASDHRPVSLRLD